MATTKRPAVSKAKTGSHVAAKPAIAAPASAGANPAIQAQVVIILILAVLFLLFAVTRYT